MGICRHWQKRKKGGINYELHSTTTKRLTLPLFNSS